MSTLTPANGVPRNLRRWFVIHFVADILFAIPLLLIPEAIMPLRRGPEDCRPSHLAPGGRSLTWYRRRVTAWSECQPRGLQGHAEFKGGVGFRSRAGNYPRYYRRCPSICLALPGYLCVIPYRLELLLDYASLDLPA